MKRYLLFLITGATLLSSISSHAAGVAGSLGESDGANSNPHNLSSQSLSAVRANLIQTIPGKETQICIFCHTPHSAVANTPLWNRPDPDGPNPPGDGTFPFRVTGTLKIDDAGIVNTTQYDAATSAAADGYPNGASKLCLSCHDGVTAIGILNSASIDMTIPNLSTRASQIVLTTSHPISFVYNSTVEIYLGDPSYNVPSLASGYLDGDSRVQCTSCHQPHQDTRAGIVGNLPFWRYGTGGNPATDYDPVCQACHVGTPAVTDEHNF